MNKELEEAINRACIEKVNETLKEFAIGTLFLIQWEIHKEELKRKEKEEKIDG